MTRRGFEPLRASTVAFETTPLDQTWVPRQNVQFPA